MTLGAQVFETRARPSAPEALASLLSLQSPDYRQIPGTARSPAQLTRAEAGAILAGLSTPAETAFRARYLADRRALDLLAFWTHRQTWPAWPDHAPAQANISTALHQRLARAAAAEYAQAKPLPAYRIRQITRTGEARWPDLAEQFKHMIARLACLDDQIRTHCRRQFRG